MINNNFRSRHYIVSRIVFFMVSLSSIFIIACESDKDNDLPPEISAVVVGNHEGGDDVPRGDDMHVNFVAKSQSGANLDFYHILIQDHDEYKIVDEEFRDEAGFQGLMEASVHGHIAIPETALLGSYHVIITVTDEDGNSADTESLETHIEIIE